MRQLTDKDIELHSATQESIYLFAEYFLKHLLLSDSPPFHLEVYKMLPSGKRIVLASPRGFAKSTMVSVIYPIWLALWKGASDIVIISASETLAVDWLRKIKFELCNNQRVREYF